VFRVSMKAVVVCALLCIVAAVALETLPKRDEPKGLGQQPKPFQPLTNQLNKKLTQDKIKKGTSGSGSGSGSSSGSQHKHADPKLLALKAVDIFGDADGSAGFKGQRVLEHTVAEVPAKKHGSSSSSSGSSRSSSSGSRSGTKKEKVLGKLAQKLNKKHKKEKKEKHSSKKEEAKKSPRTQRPLFNFKTSPLGADSVVLRKHHFSLKHHKLVSSFANKNEKVHLVLVVDAFVSPRGRPSKKHGDKKKRGHRKSDVNIQGLHHHNVFIFDDKGKQLFPKSGSSSSSSGKSSGSSSAKKSLLDIKKPLGLKTPPPPPSPLGQQQNKLPQLGKH